MRYGSVVRVLGSPRSKLIRNRPDTNKRLLSTCFGNEESSANENSTLFEQVCGVVTNTYADILEIRDGKLPSYVRRLAAANPNIYAAAICSADGEIFSVGDVEVAFTLQSAVFPIMYATAVQLCGFELVSSRIGHEPSGDKFDAFTLNEGRIPHNPFVKAGGIISAGLIKTIHKQQVDAFQSVESLVKKCTGNACQISFDNRVFLAELDQNARAMALAHFMAETSPFLAELDIAELIELYISACCITVNTHGLAAIASTFAMDGVCPITNERVCDSRLTRDIMSLMYNCGMYDYSGRFAFEVGIPAKSGISGALFMSIPGELGIAIFSPLLDNCGNSVRGVRLANHLVQSIPRLHLFHFSNQ